MFYKNWLKFIVGIVLLVVFSFLDFKFVLANEQIKSVETFESNEKIIIDQTHFGDLFLKANEIQIKSEINGDLFIMSENIFIEDTAKINGNIFLLSYNIKINGVIKGNVYVVGTDFMLENIGQIDGRVYAITEKMNLFGKLNSRVYAQSFNAVLDAKFLDNVFLSVNEYSFGENTNFNSNLTIYGEKLVELPKEKIKGEFVLKNVSFGIGNVLKNFVYQEFSIVQFIIQFFSMTLFGYLILALWGFKIKQVFYLENNKVVSLQMSKLWKPFLIGFLSQVAVPFLILSLLFTIIGSSIAFVLLLFMLISLIVGGILFSIFIGSLLNKFVLSKIKKTDFFKSDNSLIKSMFCGVALFLVLTTLPYFGFFFKLFGLVFGVGLFWQIVFNTFDKNDKTE